jgi:hypothetical protein
MKPIQGKSHQDVSESRDFFESVFERIPGMIYVHDLVNDTNLYRSWSLKKNIGIPRVSIA